MRKVLLGTTALVAASFVASAAMADEMMAEPISASVGGHYFVALGGVSGDDGVGEPRADMHSTLMAQDLQLVFSGSTTLDNGMTVSLRAAMDSDHGDTGNAHWDERSVTLGGAFGRLQLGSVESARQQTTTFAPNAAGMMGINTPYFTFAGALVRYNDGIGAEDALKLIYFTPSMNGFSVGVSYAPEDSGGSQYGGASDDDERLQEPRRCRRHLLAGLRGRQRRHLGGLRDLRRRGPERHELLLDRRGESCGGCNAGHRSLHPRPEAVKILFDAHDLQTRAGRSRASTWRGTRTWSSSWVRANWIICSRKRWTCGRARKTDNPLLDS